MDPLILGLLGLGAMLFLIGIRTHLAVALGLVGFVGLILAVGWPEGGSFDFSRGWNVAWNYIAYEPYSFIASFTLVAVPLFLLMGYVGFYAGFTKDLYHTARMWLSGIPGGLALASVVGCAMFAAISGSSMATAAAMGKLAVPEMLRYKYDKGLATGVVAASGTLGSLIPPSILMILYAIFTEQSVGKLLIAGIIPGILSAAIYMLMIWVRAKINPQLAPAPERATWHERFSSLKGTWSIILLFIIVMGGIYFGIVTPTEAAAAGAFGACVLSLLARRMTPSNAKEALFETVLQTSSIFAIVLGAKVFVGFITITGLADSLATLIVHLDLSPIAFLLAASLMYIILGTFMDPLGIMMLTLPVVTPVVVAMGYDLIWFGIIMIKLLEIGLITPPIGVNVFVLKGVVGDEVRLETIFKGISWFLLMDIVTLVILILFPAISLWLPNTLW